MSEETKTERLIELTDAVARRLQALLNNRPGDISQGVWLAAAQDLLVKRLMSEEDGGE